MKGMMNFFTSVKHNNIVITGLICVICIGFSFQANAEEGKLKKCLIVASYHMEFPGQRLKVEGARAVLKGKCEIRQFDMDTKRNPAPEFCRKKALEAKALIESWNPDVVIAIEDNASKYLVKPYFKDAKIPFVFSGVDWTAKEYAYPYSNATGMIETFPTKQLIKQIKRIIPDVKTGVCIRGDRLSEKKCYQRYKRAYRKFNIEVTDRPVRSFDEFKKAYTDALASDFIIFQNYSGIKGWDDAEAKKFILDNSEKLVVSQLKWMADFSMVSITQVIEEQGEYAAEVALKILEGANPDDFPIIANRKWNIYINKPLLEKVGIKIPRDLLHKAERVK
ncbi:ABC transporter substrate binding protein [Desulfobacterales bacterium HSG16]|nr:ABC transporter substrate binding protein [Desulfobacterales bacterium HSG16]